MCKSGWHRACGNKDATVGAGISPHPSLVLARSHWDYSGNGLSWCGPPVGPWPYLHLPAPDLMGHPNCLFWKGWHERPAPFFRSCLLPHPLPAHEARFGFAAKTFIQQPPCSTAAHRPTMAPLTGPLRGEGRPHRSRSRNGTQACRKSTWATAAASGRWGPTQAHCHHPLPPRPTAHLLLMPEPSAAAN